MPILPPEPAFYPADLLTAEPTESLRNWLAVYTKARQEKAIARELFELQIPFYLPLVERTQLRGGRRIKSQSPLFAGYIFLFADDEERLRCLQTNRVSRVLPVDDQDQLLRDLQQVQQLIDSKAALTVESRLGPGDPVRIRSGSFMGMDGIVDSRRGKYRLIVVVHFLQQGVSVELEDVQLEPIR